MDIKLGNSPIFKRKYKGLCSICLCDLGRNGKVILNCGHKFHLDCYMNLQADGDDNIKKKCPNCRSIQKIPTLCKREENNNTSDTAAVNYLLESLLRENAALRRDVSRLSNNINREESNSSNILDRSIFDILFAD